MTLVDWSTGSWPSTCGVPSHQSCSSSSSCGAPTHWGEVRMLWVNLIPGVGISIIIIAFKIGIDALFPKRLPWE